MIRSMTGFARSEQAGPWGTLTWELRSVNHRYLEAGCRLPEELRGAEGEFRQTIAGVLRRGKVDCTCNFKSAAAGAGQMRIDADLVDALLACVREIAGRAAQARTKLHPPDPIDLLRWPGVAQDAERDLSPLLAAAQAGLQTALQALGEVRAREGERLAGLIEQRCAGLLQLVEAVTARLPEVRARMRARLEEKLAQLKSEANPDRLEQELLILAQKMDVDEELDRLRGHIEEVRQTLDSPEPAGRRLDFLMQELNREANTLSSKSQDLETTRAAMDMKVLIDQMREQVQNVE
jgi:uncharacterized protein (TIGR00255 family)